MFKCVNIQKKKNLSLAHEITGDFFSSIPYGLICTFFPAVMKQIVPFLKTKPQSVSRRKDNKDKRENKLNRDQKNRKDK